MSKKNGAKVQLPTEPRPELAKALGSNEKPQIVIPRPNMQTFSVGIVGLSPLMVHAWSEKARRSLPGGADHGRSASEKKAARGRSNPEKEAKDAAYTMPDGRYAFPAAAFKQAAVSACRLVDGLTMTEARILLITPQDLVPLECPEPAIDARPVRLNKMGSVEMRYRPVFWPWRLSLEVRYNASATTLEQIINLLVLAGECVGVGEWRPEKGGRHGRFTVGS